MSDIPKIDYEIQSFGMLRAYDEAVYKWLRGCYVKYGLDEDGDGDLDQSPIITVMATPQKAFSSVAQLLIKNDVVNAPTPLAEMEEAEVQRLVWYPFVSFQRGEHRPDTDRAHPSFIYRAFERRGNEYIDHPNPIPIIIPYSVTLWTKSLFSLNYIEEWIEGQLSRPGSNANEMYLRVDHDIWGTQIHAFRKVNNVSTTDREGIEFVPVEMKAVYDFELHARLYLKPDEDSGAPPAVIIQGDNYEDDEDGQQLSSSYSTANLADEFGFPYLMDTLNAEVELTANQDPPTYEMEFQPSGVVYTKEFIIPSNASIEIDFYHEGTDDVTFQISDLSGSVVHEEILNSGGTPERIHFFMYLSTNFQLRWAANSGSIIISGLRLHVRNPWRSSTELVDDSEMDDVGISAWTPVGAPTLNKGDVGGNRYLRVETSSDGDGAAQTLTLSSVSGVYLFLVKAFECTGRYVATVQDPFTGVSSQVTLDASNLVSGFYISGYQDLEITVVQDGLAGHVDLDFISVREYNGNIT